VLDEGPQFRLLYDLGCAFAARLELDELIPLVVGKCREVLDAEGAAVLLLDAERSELYFPYVAEEDPEVAGSLADLRLPADQGIAGAVLRSGEPARIDDASVDPRFYADIDRHTGLSTRSILCAPLPTQRGTLGVIEVVNRRGGGAFSDGDLSLLAALAGSVAVAIEKARLWEQLKASAEQLRAQVGVLRRDLARRGSFEPMIGTGAPMASVFRLMESAAASPIAVLIEGETGTGKELVARGIHAASARASEPFAGRAPEEDEGVRPALGDRPETRLGSESESERVPFGGSCERRAAAGEAGAANSRPLGSACAAPWTRRLQPRAHLRQVCRAGFAGRGTPSALPTGRHSRCPCPTRDKVSGRSSPRAARAPAARADARSRTPPPAPPRRARTSARRPSPDRGRGSARHGSA